MEVFWNGAGKGNEEGESSSEEGPSGSVTTTTTATWQPRGDELLSESKIMEGFEKMSTDSIIQLCKNIPIHAYRFLGYEYVTLDDNERKAIHSNHIYQSTSLLRLLFERDYGMSRDAEKCAVKNEEMRRQVARSFDSHFPVLLLAEYEMQSSFPDETSAEKETRDLMRDLRWSNDQGAMTRKMVEVFQFFETRYLAKEMFNPLAPLTTTVDLLGAFNGICLFQSYGRCFSAPILSVLLNEPSNTPGSWRSFKFIIGDNGNFNRKFGTVDNVRRNIISEITPISSFGSFSEREVFFNVVLLQKLTRYTISFYYPQYTIHGDALIGPGSPEIEYQIQEKLGSLPQKFDLFPASLKLRNTIVGYAFPNRKDNASFGTIYLSNNGDDVGEPNAIIFIKAGEDRKPASLTVVRVKIPSADKNYAMSLERYVVKNVIYDYDFVAFMVDGDLRERPREISWYVGYRVTTLDNFAEDGRRSNPGELLRVRNNVTEKSSFDIIEDSGAGRIDSGEQDSFKFLIWMKGTRSIRNGSKQLLKMMIVEKREDGSLYCEKRYEWTGAGKATFWADRFGVDSILFRAQSVYNSATFFHFDFKYGIVTEGEARFSAGRVHERLDCRNELEGNGVFSNSGRVRRSSITVVE